MDIACDAACARPARQREAFAAGLEGNRVVRDRPPGFGRSAPPASQQPEQRLLVRREFLQRMSVDARNDRRNKPARLAQLDDRNERAILLQGGEGSAQVVRLWHEALHRWFPATMVPSPRRPPHSISGPWATQKLPPLAVPDAYRSRGGTD